MAGKYHDIHCFRKPKREEEEQEGEVEEIEKGEEDLLIR